MGPRRTLADTFIDGYFIPKETTVLMAVGDLHIDPRIWCEPKKFKPERFIDQRGALKNIEHLYPFGLGEFKILLLCIFLVKLCRYNATKKLQSK